MNRLDAKLKQIERQLWLINNPAKTPNRTLLPNAKTRELKNLSEKIFEAQKLINELEFAEAGIYQNDLDHLEAMRRELLFPAIQILCEC
jgi:hypothetical protein